MHYLEEDVVKRRVGPTADRLYPPSRIGRKFRLSGVALVAVLGIAGVNLARPFVSSSASEGHPVGQHDGEKKACGVPPEVQEVPQCSGPMPTAIVQGFASTKGEACLVYGDGAGKVIPASSQVVVIGAAVDSRSLKVNLLVSQGSGPVAEIDPLKLDFGVATPSYFQGNDLEAGQCAIPVVPTGTPPAAASR